MRRLLTGLCLLIAGSAAASGQVAGTRPNIILLVLDDQDAYSPCWDAMPATSAMVRDRGVTFRTAIAPTPICTPGRVTLISGKLAHNTGVFTLVGPNGGARYNELTMGTFSATLDSLGYVNALVGKSWGDTAISSSFHVWCSLSGDKMYEGYGYIANLQRRGGPLNSFVSNQYSTDFLADRTVGFLQEMAGRPQPFFLWLAPTAPHLPLPPAPRHAAIARATWAGKLPKDVDYNERDVSDKSSWLRVTAAVRSAAVPYASQEYPKRMGSLLAVDEMMARVRDVLVAQGKWANTVVIVTSDNGYNLGAHRLIHKMAPYEESIRVTLVIAGPGIAHGVVDKIVGLHDIGPTIVALAGGPPQPAMDGKPLVPFLRAGNDLGPASVGWRSSIVTEYDSGGVTPGYDPGGAMRVGWELDIPTFRSIRTDRYKFIHWVATGEEELYDLTADPFELSNLIHTSRGNRSVAALQSQLRARLMIEGSAAGPASP
jgi:N-acetylglucosamine-6-sulfatase